MKNPLFILFFTLCTLLSQYTLHSQWVQQTIPVAQNNNPITGIKFIDTLRGWAITGKLNNATNQDTANVLHTTNGGTNWFIQLSRPSFVFNAIAIIDSLTGYIAGDSIGGVPPFTTASPRFYKTIDGGFSWSNIPLIPNMAITDMQFINKDSAWECGLSSGPDVRTTTDGGMTWQVRTNGIVSQTERIFFLNYNTGFCGAYFNFYKTTNAGLSWALLGNFSSMVLSIYFLNSNTGWIGSDQVYYTSNSGLNWNSQVLPSSVFDLYFVNINTGWAGTPFDVYKTTNAGFSWGRQIDSSGSKRISIIDSLYGWTGEFGISHTINGGGAIVGIKQTSSQTPSAYKLFQNLPNPFNPNTKIKFQISKPGFVILKVTDILGREIKTLVNQKLISGSYETEFNGSNLPSGIYFYMLITENFIETNKMILIK